MSQHRNSRGYRSLRDTSDTKIRLHTGLALALVLCAPLATADTYAGAGQCASCHKTESIKQMKSAHANALFPVSAHPLAAAFIAQPLGRRGTYQYRFALAPGLQVRINDESNELVLPVEWAFGAGRQAVTFVTRVNPDWYLEHSATYYSAPKRYGITPGQDALRPATLKDAAGALYKVDDPANGIAACFQCHSTGPVSFDLQGSPQISELGVKCEACHGPAAAHAKNPKVSRAPTLQGLSAIAVSNLCGRCHRPPATNGEKIDWNYAWNVRHQPVYLNESRCFQKSASALSCITCHDPHESAGEKSVASYNRICQSCHTRAVHSPKPACLTERQGNCIDCHMPLVSPQPALRFTNHWIGKYREGSKLRPIR